MTPRAKRLHAAIDTLERAVLRGDVPGADRARALVLRAARVEPCRACLTRRTRRPQVVDAPPGVGRPHMRHDLTGLTIGPFLVLEYRRTPTRDETPSPWWSVRCTACGLEQAVQGVRLRNARPGCRGCKARASTIPEVAP